MSAKYTFLAWDTPIKEASTKLVMLQLANNSNDNGFSYYSISKMAKSCGMSERTFMRKIQKLEELGLLSVERRANRSSLYTLIGQNMGVTNCHLQESGVSDCHAGVSDCHLEGDKLSHDPNSNPNNYPNNSLVQAKPKRSKFKYSDDDFRFAEEMFIRIQVVIPTAKKPNFENWANTIRLMRESDNRDHKTMWAVFTWANKDSFWCSNILSPDKLRKQFDKLQVKRNETNQPRTNATGASSTMSAAQSAIATARLERDSAQSGSPMGFNGGDVYGQVDSQEWSGRVIDMD